VLLLLGVGALLSLWGRPSSAKNEGASPQTLDELFLDWLGGAAPSKP